MDHSYSFLFAACSVAEALCINTQRKQANQEEYRKRNGSEGNKSHDPIDLIKLGLLLLFWYGDAEQPKLHIVRRLLSYHNVKND